MTSDDLRALAARVPGEEPSRELDADIWDSLGLTEAEEDHARMWCRQDGRTDLTRRQFLRAWSPEYTISHDAASGAIPSGWRVVVVHDSGRKFTVTFRRGFSQIGVDAEAPTLPRAVTAAGLLARAVDAEQKESAA